MVMVEQLILFFLQDALFLLGMLSRGNAFPKPLSRDNIKDYNTYKSNCQYFF